MKNEGNLICKGIITLLKGVGTIVEHLIKLVYLAIKGFDNLNAKLFLKLPRIIRVLIIYSLIAGTTMFILTTTKVIANPFM